MDPVGQQRARTGEGGRDDEKASRRLTGRREQPQPRHWVEQHHDRESVADAKDRRKQEIARPEDHAPGRGSVVRSAARSLYQESAHVRQQVQQRYRNDAPSEANGGGEDGHDASCAKH
jgi:hypothetical protein